MQEEIIKDDTILELPPQINERKRFFKVMFSRPIVVIFAIVILGAILTALFAPMIAPYDPYKQDLLNLLAPPSSALSK